MERTLYGCDASCSGRAGREEPCRKLGPAGVRMFSVSTFTQRPEPEAGSPSAELNPLLQAPAPGDEAGTGGTSVSSHGPGKAGAKLRGIAMSPKKINLFATLIRRMHVEDALAQCRLHPKKAGKIIAGVINSAKANAENNHGMDASKLAVDIINVGSGQHLKKMWIHGRGKSAVRRLYRTNLEIILAETDKRTRMQYVEPLLERRRKKIDPPREFIRFGSPRGRD